MKQILFAAILTALLTGCNSETTTEGVVTAVNGTSCSVAPEYSQEESSGEYQKLDITQIGARISCTDGSFAIILNGEKGEQGLQGVQGIQGNAGQSCQASRSHHSDYVTLQCPNQRPVYISDGRDGSSCTSKRLSKSVEITCGHKVTYVYDGQDGEDGHSIVTQVQSANSRECVNGGSRLDLYLDRDDNNRVSRSDSYLSSVVTCNGQNGAQGIQGVPGERGPVGAVGPQGLTGAMGLTGATGAVGPQGIPGVAGPVGSQGPQGPQGIQGNAGAGSGATITNYGSSSCTRITGTNSYVKPTGSNNLGLYTSSSCASNTKFAEVSEGEAYWVSANSLATEVNGCLRVITFN